MTVRFSILLKSRASLTCFRACFLPGLAKDLSAPRYNWSGFSDIEEEKAFTPFLESDPVHLTAADDVNNGNQTGNVCIM